MVENSHKETLNRLMETSSIVNQSNSDNRSVSNVSGTVPLSSVTASQPSSLPSLLPTTGLLTGPSLSSSSSSSLTVQQNVAVGGPSTTTTTTTTNSATGYLGTNAQICCLVEEGTRCNRLAGNACFNKRIQRTIVQRKLRLAIDGAAKHIYICDHHKNIIQSMRSITKRKRKEEEEENNSNDEYSFQGNCNVAGLNCSGYGATTTTTTTTTTSNYEEEGSTGPNVDLSSLQVSALRRYKRFYRVSTKPGLNKSLLAEVNNLIFRISLQCHLIDYTN